MLVESVPPTTHARVGVMSTDQFKIKAGAHAFKILSSGLYSNKIAAVLREIGCNAVDAHVAIGAPTRPIKVKMPTALDPQFYIQDFGPGLPDDFIRRNYTTYFDSTKSGDNNQIGGFGLGSKSPFAYTDQFRVESSYDGVVTTYVAYIDPETGAPCISQMGQVPAPADWPHGVRVSLPVQAKDHQEFRDTALKVFRYFNVMPEVTGLHGLEPIKYTARTPKFGWPECSNSYTHASFEVIMGGVAYTVTLTQAATGLDPRKSSFLSHLMTRRLHMFFNVGEVQVTPSRESLDMTPSTRNALHARINELIEYVCEQQLQPLAAFRKSTDAITKLSDALGALYQTHGVTNDNIHEYLRVTRPNAGIDKYTPLLTVIQTGSVRLFPEYSYGSNKPWPHVETNDSVIEFSLSRNPRTQEPRLATTTRASGVRWLYVSSRHPTALLWYPEDDAPKRWRERVKLLLIEGKYQEVICWPRRISAAYEQAVKAELDELPFTLDHLTHVDLPEVPKRPRAAPGTRPKRVKKTILDKPVQVFSFPNGRIQVTTKPLRDCATKVYVKSHVGWGTRYWRAGSHQTTSITDLLNPMFTVLNPAVSAAQQLIDVAEVTEALADKLVAEQFKTLPEFYANLQSDPVLAAKLTQPMEYTDDVYSPSYTQSGPVSLAFFFDPQRHSTYKAFGDDLRKHLNKDLVDFFDQTWVTTRRTPGNGATTTALQQALSQLSSRGIVRLTTAVTTKLSGYIDATVEQRWPALSVISSTALATVSNQYTPAKAKRLADTINALCAIK